MRNSRLFKSIAYFVCSCVLFSVLVFVSGGQVAAFKEDQSSPEKVEDAFFPTEEKVTKVIQVNGSGKYNVAHITLQVKSPSSYDVPPDLSVSKWGAWTSRPNVECSTSYSSGTVSITARTTDFSPLPATDVNAWINANTACELWMPGKVVYETRSNATPTPVPTNTPTPAPTDTPTPTPTRKPTASPTPKGEATPTPKATKTPTPTSTPTSTSTPTPTPEPTATPAPTDTPTPTSEPTDTSVSETTETSESSETSDTSDTSASGIGIVTPSDTTKPSDPSDTTTTSPSSDSETTTSETTKASSALTVPSSFSEVGASTVKKKDDNPYTFFIWFGIIFALVIAIYVRYTSLSKKNMGFLEILCNFIPIPFLKKWYDDYEKRSMGIVDTDMKVKNGYLQKPVVGVGATKALRPIRSNVSKDQSDEQTKEKSAPKPLTPPPPATKKRNQNGAGSHGLRPGSIKDQKPENEDEK